MLTAGSRIGRYEVLASLGAGGMGEVYRARDTTLGREVALKVLPGLVAGDADRLARFEREAQMLASLNHSNIAAIHGIEDAGGVRALALELVKGDTLADRIARGPMSVDDVLSIGRQIAEALDAAHRQGIIHRDLKPANVMITANGVVKVLDFGLARWTSPAGLSDETVLTATRPGIVMGTVAYMSPEQARGVLAEAPSDIFSLGCVLYEMLAGRRPFDRRTSAETMAAILSEEPKRLAGSGRQIPPDLEGVVAHCLKKRPQERIRSARDLALQLQTVGTRPVASATTAPPETIDSLAVLPFVNAGGNPDTEYLSDGIAESLINSLSQVPGLRVVPRSRAFRYKGQDVDARKVGRQLKVRALLTGKVLQRGDVLNVQAELVDVERESQLWGERFHRKAADLFTVEEEIAKQISEHLQLKLSGLDRRRLVKRYTENTEAYHLYLKGHYHWNRRTGEGLGKAIEYFQQAIDTDAAYALAYAGLANGYVVLPFFAPVPPKVVFGKAKAAALKALEIDPDLSEALTALGPIQCCLDWDWAGAERSMRRAIELRPDYWLAHDHCGLVLSAQGRHEEALREVERGLDLEPMSVVVSGHHLPWISILARRYDQAIDSCRKALELDPTFHMASFWLGLASGLTSRHDEAIALLQTAASALGTVSSKGELARAYAVAGRIAEAQRILAELHDTFDHGYAEPYSFATIYAALGEPDLAFEWLERASQNLSGHFAMWVGGDPRLDSLRSDQRMRDLLRRIGLNTA